MAQSQEKERIRLFKQDENLRSKGRSVLEESGIGEIINEAGFHPVGSFIMKTMTWRDLDFERYDENPSWKWHWDLGNKLSELDWIWSLHCNDSYRDPRTPFDYGYYWGLRVSDPNQTGSEFWKIDLWTARKKEFESSSPNREFWNRLMTEEKRYVILAIKDSIWTHPQYRQRLLSVHIYEAVLENEITDTNDFWEWWNTKYSK